MTKTVDVVAGGIVASAWGNEVRDRSWQQFVDRTELLAQWPNAPEGSHAWLQSTRTPMVKTSTGWSPERQSASVAGTTNSAGGFVITFPVPFLTAPAMAVMDGDAGSTGLRYFGLVVAQYNAATVGLAIWDNAGPWTSRAIRVQWLAIMR